MDLYEIGEYVEGLRRDITEKCLSLGLMHLAEVAAEGSDPDDVVAAAELDAISAGCPPDGAYKAVEAGGMAIHILQMLKHTSSLVMSPEVEDDQ